MLDLPVSTQTFKRDFLNGTGNLEISGTVFDPTQPFQTTVTSLVTAGGSVNPSWEFGTAGGLTCKVDVHALAKSGIELVWPGAQTDFTKQYGLTVPVGKVGAHVYFQASASGAVDTMIPIAAATSFEFGIKAGAGVGYDRYCVYDSKTIARTLLTDLVTGLRLPQNCGALDRMPGPGELLVFDYNGYLDLTAALNWGYQISGSHDLTFNDLNAAVNYDLRLKAAVSAGYSLGGEFSLSAQQGHAAGWVRVTVKKKRTAEFDFAASFSADASLKLTGLPSSADEFLTALLGADAKSALNLFGKIKNYTDLSKVEQDAGNLLTGSLNNLANKWVGKLLDQSTVAQFLTVVNKVATDYENADQIVVNAVTNLYQDYLGNGTLGVLKSALQKIAGLNSRDGLATLSDSDAWAVINQLVGGDLFKLMQDNAVFAQITGIAQKTLDFVNGGWQTELKDVIDELQAAFPLDKVFGEIAQYSTKDKLLGLVDQKLQGVVEKLLGTVWTQINASNVGTFAKQLNGILTQIDTFKTTWYQKIQQAANQSFNLQASYAYTSATEDDALIDVDIDLTAQGGPALFEAAVHGKFKTVFLVPNSPALRVYHGVLTHQLTQSAQLQISVLGWQFTSLQQVVANTEIAIQTGPAGQIQVFTTAAAIKQRKQRTETHGSDKTTETTESDFLLRFVGETTLAQGSPDGPYLIQNINNMAAEYDLSYSDDKTAPEELLNYLSLAETVGLIPSTQDFAAELAKQFPQGLGKVTAQYVVTFDNDGVRDAFTAPVGTAAALAHSVTTGLIRAQLLHRNVTDNNVMIALAALDPTVRKVFVTQGWTAVRDGTWTVGVPAFLGGGQETLNPALNLLLVTLLQMEFAFAEGFAQLDALVKNAKTTGTPAPVDKLQALATSFVEKVADISDYGRINSMFAVFDALVHAGSNGKGYRNSTLILQIQAGDPKSMVTKYLSSGTPKVQAAPLALGAA